MGHKIFRRKNSRHWIMSFVFSSSSISAKKKRTDTLWTKGKEKGKMYLLLFDLCGRYTNNRLFRVRNSTLMELVQFILTITKHSYLIWSARNDRPIEYLSLLYIITMIFSIRRQQRKKSIPFIVLQLPQILSEHRYNAWFTRKFLSFVNSK